MTDKREQDKPIDVHNATDHRPESENGPLTRADGDPTHQNPAVKQPDPALLQKQQRSQGMNRSS